MIRASASRLSSADLPGSRRQRGDPPPAKPRHERNGHIGVRGIVADRISTSKGSPCWIGMPGRTNRFAAEGAWGPQRGLLLPICCASPNNRSNSATVPDVEQRIIDLERKHLRHHSATLAILSACWCSPRDRLSSRRSRQFRAPPVACPPAQNIGIVGHWVCSFDPLRRTDPCLRVRMLRFVLWAALTSGALRAEVVSKTAAAKTQE